MVEVLVRVGQYVKGAIESKVRARQAQIMGIAGSVTAWEEETPTRRQAMTIARDSNAKGVNRSEDFKRLELLWREHAEKEIGA